MASGMLSHVPVQYTAWYKGLVQHNTDKDIHSLHVHVHEQCKITRYSGTPLKRIHLEHYAWSQSIHKAIPEMSKRLLWLGELPLVIKWYRKFLEDPLKLEIYIQWNH